MVNEGGPTSPAKTGDLSGDFSAVAKKGTDAVQVKEEKAVVHEKSQGAGYFCLNNI